MSSRSSKKAAESAICLAEAADWPHYPQFEVAQAGNVSSRSSEKVAVSAIWGGRSWRNNMICNMIWQKQQIGIIIRNMRWHDQAI